MQARHVQVIAVAACSSVVLACGPYLKVSTVVSGTDPLLVVAKLETSEPEGTGLGLAGCWDAGTLNLISSKVLVSQSLLVQPQRFSDDFDIDGRSDTSECIFLAWVDTRAGWPANGRLDLLELQFKPRRTVAGAKAPSFMVTASPPGVTVR
jgi:hypothetical protein